MPRVEHRQPRPVAYRERVPIRVVFFETVVGKVEQLGFEKVVVQVQTQNGAVVVDDDACVAYEEACYGCCCCCCCWREG